VSVMSLTGVATVVPVVGGTVVGGVVVGAVVVVVIGASVVVVGGVSPLATRNPTIPPTSSTTTPIRT
jgi:hypothetical protein